MVLGFLGTLVALERAVALRRTWAYAAPVALGLGGVALVAPVPLEIARVLLVGAAASNVGSVLKSLEDQGLLEASREVRRGKGFFYRYIGH